MGSACSSSPREAFKLLWLDSGGSQRNNCVKITLGLIGSTFH